MKKLTPILYHPMQNTGFSFISLKKIPEFVRQAKRPTTTFKGYTDLDFELAHDPEYIRGIQRQDQEWIWDHEFRR